MVEGVSGLLAVHRARERPAWIPSRRRLEWPNGAVAQVFSAEDPESLRGPQFAAAWCDELAKWRHAEATFDMLQFGLRLGERPRQVITTTPRPIALLKRLIADPRDRGDARRHRRQRAPSGAGVPRRGGRRATPARGSAARRSTARSSRSAPTRCGRARVIESCRVAAAPPLQRIVVAVDPPASAGKGADACGIVAAGRAENGTIYVIADETARRAFARRLGAQGDRAVAQASRRRAGGRGQPGRRHGARGDRRGRCRACR